MLTASCNPEEVSSVQEMHSDATKLVTVTPQVPTEITLMIAPTVSTSVSITAPIPTLTAIEREAIYQNFMATNGGCELPCWWGVRLGDSLEDVDQTFIGLGMPWLGVGHSRKVDSDQMGTFSAGYYDRHEDVIVARLDTNMEFHELDNSIEYIYVDVDRVGGLERSQQEFIRDWEQYYLSSFLQRYGKPTQVYFRIRSVGDLMLTPQFSVSLLYREQGLAITYHIEGNWLNEEYTQAEVCLGIAKVRALELSLFNPDGFDIWGYQFAPYHDKTYRHSENLNCIFLNSG
jgi:hypothetical protein